MKNVKPLLLCLIATQLCGCYYLPRSWDSYHSTFKPSPVEPNRADPYTFGGIAEGSGGTQTRTSYATDSKSTDPRSYTDTGRSAMFDQPRIDPGTGTVPAPQPTAGGFNASPATPQTPTNPIHKPDIEPQKGAPMNAPPMRG